jgi:hypothetical protein
MRILTDVCYILQEILLFIAILRSRDSDTQLKLRLGHGISHFPIRFPPTTPSTGNIAFSQLTGHIEYNQKKKARR